MPGPSAKSRPAFDQRAVFCKRHTRHGETDAGRGEGKRRLWRHVVESVLPGGRCVRHNAQRTALARSRPWKWDRRLPRRSDRCRAVRCLLALEEAGEDHGARGVDVVPGPSRAAAQRKRSGRTSGVAAEMEAVDIGPAMAGIDRDVGEHAPLATPSRQEPVTCASMPETKPPRLRSAEAAFLLSSKSVQCPAHKQAVERQPARWHSQAPSARHQSRASWLAYRARSLAGLDDLGPMCQIGPLARGRFACHHSFTKGLRG